MFFDCPPQLPQERRTGTTSWPESPFFKDCCKKRSAFFYVNIIAQSVRKKESAGRLFTSQKKSFPKKDKLPAGETRKTGTDGCAPK
jgi:hypothetical protein